MRIAITGANGFLGRNLRFHLMEQGHCDIISVTRQTPVEELPKLLANAEFVFHLAGVNRPPDPSAFKVGNAGFTAALCDALGTKPIPIAFASSTQAELDNLYGASKLLAEQVLEEYGRRNGAPVQIFRLPNVFGKWSRPNYNSAVATFCHNIARNQSISIHDPAAPLRLVYVDDVVAALSALLLSPQAPGGFREVKPEYQTTVGALAAAIHSFEGSRKTLLVPPVGEGLLRALHATYLSFLSPARFSYSVPIHADPRGIFVEMLKTDDSGQFSYFTAHPGITRGEHYHHTKTEKFLVIQGVAEFRFRNIDTGELADLCVKGGDGAVVESIPGWAHSITNAGDGELICMLWASEIFDREKPDTVAAKVRP
ncbi:MAG: NAD-dependent epimerase/dehydratase family protein [Hyphomicrobiaceae bacterium]|nr:NAD-dependent epimerase/dehydratase family protein [Hyphomicrobiaceae bacterium]